MRKLGRKELENIVIGAGLLGAGGGGSTAEGLKLVERVLELGSAVELADVGELPDEAWGAVIAGMGSPKASLTRVRRDSPAQAPALLEEALGFTCSFVVPFELGAGNSLNPMLAAVRRNLPIVDGDPAGRAVPELQITTFSLGGIALSPTALATEDGISAIIRTEKPVDVERVCRAITAEIGGVAAIACHAARGREVKRHLIPGTTSLVEGIGAVIRSTQAEGQDTAAALAKRFGGHILGRGKVAEHPRPPGRGDPGHGSGPHLFAR